MGQKALKRFGQNFLVNDNVIKGIIDSFKVPKENAILEIGPGEGALTKYLINGYPNYAGIEIDKRLFDTLVEKFPGKIFLNENVLKNKLDSYDAIIGNIPYNITSELLVKIVKDAQKAKFILLMVQKEAYERIVIAEKREEVTPLSLMLRIFYNYKHIMDVSKESFLPKPHVDSTVFLLERKMYINIDARQFYYFLLILFSSRRKNILNNLLFKYPKEKIMEVLSKNMIDKSRRSETLSNEELVNLYLDLN